MRRGPTRTRLRRPQKFARICGDRPFFDPKFSARTHDSSARSITARTNTTRAEVEREEKNVEEMLRRKKWLMKQLNELDAELTVIKEEAGI